jgi:hypothetical protein
MPVSQAGFADLGGAVKDLFGGIGEFESAKGYSAAAGFATQNAEIAAQSTQIQEVQAQRKIYQTLGGQQADIAGAGLAKSGNALDIMRDSAQQGSLTKQLIANQGAINVAGYEEEASNYSAMASAAKSSGTGSIIGGVISAAASIFAFSDDTLKEGIVEINRRPDGLGVYEFSFKGSGQRFRGVLASEVERLYPRAVRFNDQGLREVNYSAIGVLPEVVSG